MIVLGLGSNLGDRLANLRRALHFIQELPKTTVQKVSPIYISDALLPDDAPPHWNIPYLNLSIRCETNLSPYVFLEKIKQIEIKAGRVPEKNWGPRIIDIDILAWDDWIQYDETLHIPHEHLHERPFALWPLADVAPFWVHPIQKKTAADMVMPWGSRFTGEAPLHTKQIAQRIDTPELVGIVNITPDSFSDGGKCKDIDTTIQYIHDLVNEGADIIDIGAESTRPGAIPLTSEEEWQRLEPLLKTLICELKPFPIMPKISIDTRHANTAQKALHFNVDWINDVSGLQDPLMQEIMTETNCDIVIMHHLGIPVEKHRVLSPNEDSVAIIYHWAASILDELEKAGIERKRIIIDPGIGFGKTPEQSLELIKNINVLQKLGVRVLLGHSRKSFLQQFTRRPASERDIETVALSLTSPADYLRIHNVSMHARAFKSIKSIYPYCINSSPIWRPGADSNRRPAP